MLYNLSHLPVPEADRAIQVFYFSEWATMEAQIHRD
jgi:hypothetical protein